GKCESFNECQLKFEPLWPAVFSSGYKSLTGQFRKFNPIKRDSRRSFATTYSQGYLECSGTFGKRFLSKIDYFFTGLDDLKYLVSKPFPLESIIKMSTKLEEPIRVGSSYSFECKISTFVLLPNIEFVLGFENGVEQLAKNQNAEVIIGNSARITNTATLTWHLHLIIKNGLNKITCYAPRINSSDWVKSEFSINVTSDPIIFANTSDRTESEVNVVFLAGASPSPIIRYCASETDSLFVLQKCNFTRISNSTFDFGKIDQNVIRMESKSGPQFVFLKCEALYPIRWLAPKPLGSVHYLSTNETNRFHHDPLSKVTKSDRSGQYLNEVDDKCAECICRASSRCKRFPCNSDKVCGYIPSAYRGDTQVQEFSSCTRQEVCARENTTTLNECLDKNKLTFTWLRNRPSDYDPRIGLMVDGLPDPNFKYEFHIPSGLKYTGSLSLKPLKHAGRIYAKLHFDRTSGLIHCEITSPGTYGQPNLLVGSCASFAECQLKYDHLWPAIPGVGHNKLLHLVEEFPPSENKFRQTFGSTKYSQGYLQCDGIYFSGQHFLYKTDYFFTGLDNTRHLLSNNYPSESIIRMSSKHVQPLKEGMKYSFDCTISTFVLLPNIQFTLGFENGNVQLVTVTSQTSEAFIDNAAKITKTTALTWQLHLTVKVGLDKITCYAPRINSSDWVNSESNINVAPDLLNRYIKIGGVISGVIIVTIAVLIVIVARRKTAVVDKILPPEEVDELILNTAILNSGLGERLAVEHMNLKSELIISSQDLFIDDNKFFGAVIEDLADGKCEAVIEFSPLGNLQNYLQKHSDQNDVGSSNLYLFLSDDMERMVTLQLSALLHFCKQIATGMQFLAQKNVIHGDLATRNVLVFHNYGVKITGFGHPKKIHACSNYKSDSKNQVLFPWAWIALESLSGLRLPKPTLASVDIYNFMLTCWESNPQGRPTFSECAEFISSVEPELRQE
ncbi:unnamed protein product, partial [Allacma fusca]